jgi:drug/metabolite transporter (DMT)-like permease
MPGLGDLAALGSALTWAINNLVVRTVGRRANVVALNALMAASTSLYALILLAGLAAVLSTRGPGYLALSTICAQAVGDSLYYLALQRIGVTRAIALSMLYPVLTTLLALALGERVTARLVAGTLLTVVGVGLVVGL